MIIVDGNGNIQTLPGTLVPAQSDHPVYKARIAVALGIGAWALAATSGQNLARFKNKKASASNVDEFNKELKSYLAPYGATLVSQVQSRQFTEADFNVPKGVLNGVLPNS